MTAPDTAWAIRAEKDGDVSWVTPARYLESWHHREMFVSLALARIAARSVAMGLDEHRLTIVRVTRKAVQR